MDDTIAVISTALGASAISIVRITGDKAIDIVNKISDRDITKFNANTINYAHIIDNGNVIDEVLISVFLKILSLIGS